MRGSDNQGCMAMSRIIKMPSLGDFLTLAAPKIVAAEWRHAGTYTMCN
jgi:hypothetical protein